MLRAACIVVLIATANLSAQTPPGYLVVAELPRQLSGDGFAFVETATGVVTRIQMANGKRIGGGGSVSVNAKDPIGLYAATAGLSVLGAPLQRFDMAGNLITNKTVARLRLRGRVGHVWATGKAVYFTMTTGAAGLYQTAFPPKTVRLAPLTRAKDLVVIGTRIYVNSYLAKQPSTIVEYDIKTGKTRTLGSNYPTIRSLGVFVTSLLAGTDAGDVLRVSTSSGKFSTFRKPNKGAILAIVATSPANVFVATANNEIWRLNNLSAPVYRTKARIQDIDLGIVRRPALLLHGRGCKGQGGTIPRIAPLAGPALGKRFTLRVDRAKPSTGAALLFGASRQSWGPIRLPFDLSRLGMNGCSLLNDPLLTFATTTDSTGRIVLSFPIPNQQSLDGVHFMSQFLVLNQTLANSALSNGAEAIIH